MMNNNKDKLLKLMKDKDYVPMKAKEIAYLLNIPKNNYNELIIKLNELEKELKIIKNKKK